MYNSTKTKCIFFAQFYGTNDQTRDPFVQLTTVDKYGHEGDIHAVYIIWVSVRIKRRG